MSAVASKPAGFSGAAVWLTVAICCAIAVLEGYDIQAVGVTAAKLGPALQLGRPEMGWVFAASNVGLLIGALAGGWIADKTGRKPVLLAAVAGFGVFTLATAFAHDYPTLLAARLVTGLGLGAAMPNLMAIASDITPPARRAGVTALMFCGMPLGGAGAALFTAALPPDFDYRIVFFVGGVLPLVLLPLAAWLLRETRGAHDDAELETSMTALFGGGRAKATLLLWAVHFPMLLIIYLLVNWLPILVGGKGLGDVAGRQASLLWNLGGIAGALVIAWLADTRGPRWPLTLGFAGLLIALLALGEADGLVIVLALSALVGAFSLGPQYALYGMTPSFYPPAYRATGSGASVAAGRLGSIAGPLIGGFLPQGQTLAALAPLAAVAGIALLTLTFVSKARED